MRGYPQFSLWISIALAKIYISCIIITEGKNTFELVGTALKEKEKTAPQQGERQGGARAPPRNFQIWINFRYKSGSLLTKMEAIVSKYCQS